jgi:hypothetical protein
MYIDPIAVAICMIARDIRNWIRRKRGKSNLPDWMLDHI